MTTMYVHISILEVVTDKLLNIAALTSACDRRLGFKLGHMPWLSKTLFHLIHFNPVKPTYLPIHP